MNLKSGVYQRFVFFVVPVSVLVFIGLIAVFEWTNYRSSQIDLKHKLESTSNIYSMLVAESLHLDEHDQIRFFTFYLMSDDDIADFKLIDKLGNTIDEFSVPTTSKIYTKQTPVTYATDRGIVPVGQLTIGISENRIKKEFERRLTYELILLLASVIAILIMTRLAYLISVGKPLSNLTKAIKGYEKTGSYHPAPYKGEDELAKVSQAYNAMQELQIEANSKLVDANKKLMIYKASLEKKVKDRTKALAQELDGHKKTTSKLFIEKQRAQVTLHAIADAVLVVHTTGVVLFANPAASAYLGVKHHDMHKMTCKKILDIRDIETDKKIIGLSSSESKDEFKTYVRMKAVLNSLNGNSYTIELSTSILRDQNKNAFGYAIIFRDITESQELSNELVYQASHDMLTDLINRRELHFRLEKELRTISETESGPLILCYFDLDQFKVVNDTCGHAAGDQLLINIADILKDNLDQAELVCRLGGDEFAVLFKGIPITDVAAMLEQVRLKISDHSFAWDGQVFRVTASVGAVVYEPEYKNIDEFMRIADTACYIAKDKGRNRIHFHKDDDETHRIRHTQIRWMTRIQEALANNYFELWCQPIRATQSKEDVGWVEILVRMRLPDGTIHKPGTFLPAAERYGLATQLDQWVLSSCVKLLADQANQGLFKHCAINLSGHTISDERFLSYVLDLLNTYNLPAKSLCFEITETAAISNFSAAQKLVSTLKSKGATFSLDDFGSGVSSFGYLNLLDVDYVKIDGQFMLKLTTDKIAREMVSTIHTVSRLMGKKTIAEFVYNEDTLQVLQDIDVDYVQGNLLGEPVPVSEILADRINPQ